MADRLGEQDLREIDEYLAGEGDADKAPLKMHGDALLDGSGTRHGAHGID
ncbi:MAG: hypothetical protein M3434_02340 [Gemmatimonadota bacterium]|jgi:hypothetical protein|nr:hypothetical protein [Gemmatimonadota bacterium]